MKPLLCILASCLVAATQYAQGHDQCTNGAAKLARQADTVLTVEVIDAGSAPEFWSGYVPAKQRVAYRLNTVLKGEFRESEFSVEYYVVHGSRLSEKNTPELNRTLFKAGNKLLLFLHSRNVQLPNGTQSLLVNAVSDEECSVLLPSAATIEAVKLAATR